ncbi:MAG: class I SAM-dependent methyltransferase [Mycobacterium sp.]|nr:class I SAM-dependent methyltransferase [Mycobacterium sp.]MBV9722825.1 class I SAM-dependent methyltransferase [Mycobacterium sp.]
MSTKSSSLPEPEPHRLRQVAESFGVDAERYDRARPRYPDALIQRVIAASPGVKFLDVGCGTGIGARQYRSAGCTVLGVEPDARMAEVARRTGIDVEIGKFEDWDAGGRSFDAVVAGQAWHWVDPARGARKAAQVLRPHGLLALYWHVFDPPGEVADAFDDAMQQVAPDAPLWHRPADGSQAENPAVELQQGNVHRAVEGIRIAGGFGEPEQWRFEWQRHYARDEWLDHLPTTGTLARLAPEQLATVLQAVGTAIDSIGGGFTMHYVTLATAATRTSKT